MIRVLANLVLTFVLVATFAGVLVLKAIANACGGDDPGYGD